MDSLIRNKMFDHEVPPPAGTWEKLSERLDEWQHDKLIQARMENISIPPPTAAWNNILDRLEPQVPAAKIIPWRRWMIAASVLAVLAVSAYLLTRPGSQSEEVAAFQGPSDTLSAGNNAELVSTDTTVKEKEVADTRTYATIINSVSSSLLKNAKQVMSGLNAVTEESRQATTGQAHHRSSGYDLGVMAASSTADNSDRYYNLLDENGNLVRVSKKLSALDCVIKNGLVVPVDDKLKGADDDCTEKVKEWHKIMSTAPAIISPLDLLQVLANGK